MRDFPELRVELPTQLAEALPERIVLGECRPHTDTRPALSRSLVGPQPLAAAQREEHRVRVRRLQAVGLLDLALAHVQRGRAQAALDDCDHEIQTNGVADTSCLLKQGALSGGWTSNWLNGHGPYVVSKMLD
jgi:Zn-dependent oligopeptidase